MSRGTGNVAQHLMPLDLIPSAFIHTGMKSQNPSSSNNNSNKMVQNLNRHFSEDDVQVPDKHMNKYASSLLLRGCTVNHSELWLHFCEKVFIKRTINIGKGMEEREYLSAHPLRKSTEFPTKE